MSKILLLLSFIFILLNSSCESPLEEKSIVTASKLNVRQSASIDSQVLGQLDRGDTVSVKSVVLHGFSEITYQGRNAYVSKKYLKDIDETEEGRFEFLQSIEVADFFAFLVMLSFLGLFFWGFTRLGDSILWRLSIYKTQDIPGFYFSTPEANSGRRRTQGLLIRVLGRRPHPYLSYWVCVASRYFILPILFLFPTFLLEFDRQLNFNFSWFKVEFPLWVVWLVFGLGTPFIIFLFKSGRNIREEGGNNEWIAVSISLLFAIPALLVTLMLASITYLKYIILVFLWMMKIMVPSQREMDYMNNPEKYDY